MSTRIINDLRLPGIHLGTWISSGSAVVTELAAECGFEWLLLDLEHGLGSESDLLPQLLAVKGTKTAAVVRVPAPRPDLILRVLDLGADGIMVPHVNDEDIARECVRAMRYPPEGIRGYSRSTRARRYGLSEESRIRPLLFAQIESLEGVRRAREIASVDGMDTLFIGPADLNFDLSSRSGQPVPSYEDCLTSVAAAATEQGKSCGILLRQTTEKEKLLALGYTLLAVDSDLGILRNHYQSIFNQRIP